MPYVIHGVLFLLAVSLTGACATRGAEGTSRSVTSRDVLTQEQMARVHPTDAYQAVQKLRSNWMRLRGTTQMPTTPGSPQFTENPVLVYLNDQRLGEVETLRAIEIAAVQYIRYFSPAEASARWGLNHGGGVIYVSTRPLEP